MKKVHISTPNKVLSGENVIDDLCTEISSFGNKALIIIGQESVKNNGLYPRVVSLMNIHGIKHFTYNHSSTKATYQDADKVISIAKEKNIELIIALGDHLIWDLCKAISTGYFANHSVKEFYLQKVQPHKALPLIGISTPQISDSHETERSYLYDVETGLKKNYTSPLNYPKISFFDSGFQL